mmetsp:Transcript_23956/g.43718  ORF Transcript_23956/g.43718 Transcript_23956/m.43718 type:complete len:213 (+) Transcript_23956:975-1613(+)
MVGGRHILVGTVAYGWRRSRISCWRSGCLSMEAESSRTVQGAGLRRYTTPSFSTKASIKPRGRSCLRRADLAAGSVSVSTTTSRSINASGKASISSSCCRKRGSRSVSANTTSTRFFQRYSLRSVFKPDCINSGVFSATVSTVAVASFSAGSAVCAKALVAARNPVRTRVKRWVIVSPVETNIGGVVLNTNPFGKVGQILTSVNSICTGDAA